MNCLLQNKRFPENTGWLCCGLLISLALAGCQSQPGQVLLHTEQGDVVLQLSNQAPRHTTNFKKLVREHFYDSLLIHRVVQDLYIQTGDPDSRVAQPGMTLGHGDPGYFLPAEIKALPVRGALAAVPQAGDHAAQPASNGAQFCIIQGRPQTDESLDTWEKKLHLHFSPAERQLYKAKGGAPQLQGQCTVFGEVLAGMNVVDRIAALPHDAAGRPLQNILISMKIN